MGVIEAPVIMKTNRCKNCGGGLTRYFLPLTEEERRCGVYEKYQVVHLENGEWECPDQTGLNPHSDSIMPVSYVAFWPVTFTGEFNG